jgi:hypothetical protein
MKKYLAAICVAVLSFSAFGQDKKQTNKENEKAKTAVSADNKNAASLNLAKETLAAHGGDKLKNMKTLVVRGTADISGSPTMTFPATFATVFAGDKYRLELINAMQPFKQVYDGQQTFSSMNNFHLPPINRLGLPLLQKIEAEGFTVSAVSEKSKKKGFRITSPEGYFTDFFIDDKTKQIKSYEASYSSGRGTITTSVEIDKMREVNGIILPERYAQRFDLGQMTIYVNFKAREILVDSDVSNDVFTM